MEHADRVRADFDRLAHLSRQDAWNHNDHYHGFLLRQLPARLDSALEIGCGTGAFARLLACRAGRVMAIDLSPEMVRIARECSRGYGNIEYRVADVMAWEPPAGGFDCVASIATLHHLPLRPMLDKMRSALRPGGTLLVLDLCRAEGPAGYIAAPLAIAVSTFLRRAKTGHLRPSSEVRRAWAQHGRYDRYLTVSEVRHACEATLPGARVRKHLLWRYSLVWHKPE